VPDFLLEQKAAISGYRSVCGIDEAGRGPWAGPVVSAAVVIEYAKLSNELLSIIDDSKKLRRSKREFVCEAVKPLVAFGYGIASAQEIDKFNILNATMLSMRRAVSDLPVNIDLALVDGNKNPEIPGVLSECVVRGDSKSFSIAIASILAKVARDKIMLSLSSKYPGYGWSINSGYGTKKHIRALRALGITPEHRKTFKPIRKILGE
jgi:ribonuclease HII